MSTTAPASADRRSTIHPDLSTATLVAAITAFMIGGLTVSIADDLTGDAPGSTGVHSSAG